MPLFHVHGLIGATLSTLSPAGRSVVPPRFSAGHLLAGGRRRTASPGTRPCRRFTRSCSAVPTPTCAPRGGLRFIRSCSAALAPAVFAQLEDRFGAPVLEAYGMTEASHQMASNPLPPAPRKAGTVGRGTDVEVAILDEQATCSRTGRQGEVAIRGPNVMRGYHNNPEPTPAPSPTPISAPATRASSTPTAT